MSKTILVVEDESILALLLQNLLSHLGYIVAGPLNSGEEVLAFLAEQQVDLILMDIDLIGDLNGIETARMLHQTSDTPVIFLTGFTQDALIEEAKSASPYGYLIKPVSERDLAAALEMALHRHKLDRKLRNSQTALKNSEARVRKKLQAISEPDGDIGALQLGDIIDAEALQTMMEQFHRLTGIGIGILDNQRQVLVGVGWQDICTKFHRCHPDTLKNCIESDLVRSAGTPAGSAKAYRCKNNLWDLMTPIKVGGRHVGNVCLGQFFYDDESLDYDFFRIQAKKYGFDEAEYLAALDRVPRLSRATVAAAMDFYAGLAGMISTLSYSTINLSRALTQKDAALREFKQAEEEKKQLQSQLIQAQKMEAIGTLAGGIAHDFNNILGAILGYAEMAREDSPAGSITARDLDQIILASNRAKELVKQILAFSRQADMEKFPLQAAGIVKETIKLLRSSLPSTIAIEQNIDPATAPILADPTQIHQILMNICTNAFHAMEENGGTLCISLTNIELSRQALAGLPHILPGRFVRLSIRDTGQGIAPEIRERIFEPYFTTKESGKGTGMGLAIAHGIIKSHGGFITCESQLGEGTVFHIVLPALEENAAAERRARERVPTGSERILYIDDEMTLAGMVQIMLERLGYAVTVKTDSLDAMATFESRPESFDLVITDQTMPGMTGVDLARRMLQIRPDIPIILCTGYSNLISEDKAKALGIRGFALKPLAKNDIAVLIRKVLDTPLDSFESVTK